MLIRENQTGLNKYFIVIYCDFDLTTIFKCHNIPGHKQHLRTSSVSITIYKVVAPTVFSNSGILQIISLIQDQDRLFIGTQQFEHNTNYYSFSIIK